MSKRHRSAPPATAVKRIPENEVRSPPAEAALVTKPDEPAQESKAQADLIALDEATRPSGARAA